MKVYVLIRTRYFVTTKWRAITIVGVYDTEQAAQDVINTNTDQAYRFEIQESVLHSTTE